MMISPDGYVEFELKGKTPEKVLSKIRGLHREMAKLKNQAETQLDFVDLVVSPSPQVRIDVMRDYLVAAEEYYKSIGGKYEPSKLEQKAAAFDSNIDHICSIKVEYGGFFGGAEERTLTRDGDKIVVERFFYNGALEDEKKLYEGMEWHDLIDELTYIHMGEWRSKYVDPNVLDGTQWSVDITYDNGTRPKHFYGSNKFPYNFDRFLEFMEMER